jgi:hypothetical protein
MKLSRSFVCMLIGFAMTLFSWFGPWAWPAAPALYVLRTFFGGSYDGFAYAARAGVIIVLIAVNVTSWALVAYVLVSLLRLASRGKQDDIAPPDDVPSGDASS